MNPIGMIAGAAVKAVVGAFTKKTTVTDADGAEAEARKARPVTISLAGVLAGLLLYHFLLWPVLNHHYPEYGFPALDLAALAGVITGLGF